ncbi:hypothetical protein FRC19_005260 [Serendipita sp. 401]|nr:hypothetical protein FRC19_005260 [Serendipita sp. 401]KAG9057489.1 hypothetical protein FS842_006270 [Serendipita sp. 407]
MMMDPQSGQGQGPPSETSPTSASVPNGDTFLGDPVVSEPESIEYAPDKGYLNRLEQRKLVNGKWKIVPVDPKDGQPLVTDVFESDLFPDNECSLQIVTFFPNEAKHPVWEDPLSHNDHKQLRRHLRNSMEGTWRWINCRGLHGSTLRIVAEETGWPLARFVNIFTWTRASADYAENRLLVHFINQATHIYILYAGENERPTFITCTSLHPRREFVDRLEDFVDRGDSRIDNALRVDPSLMMYGIVRAIVQDLRANAFKVDHSMDRAYRKAMQRPSQDALSFFYQLKDKLLSIKLDATSLKNATQDLSIYSKNARGVSGRRLISTNALNRIKDQMGLIKLLSEELPDLLNQADAVGSLAFNMLSFSTNNMLKALAIITLSSISLTAIIGVMGINYFTENRLNAKQIAIILTVTGVVTVVALLTYFIRCYPKLSKRKRGDYDWDAEQGFEKGKGFNLQDLEAENKATRDHTNARDTLRPDIYRYGSSSISSILTQPRDFSPGTTLDGATSGPGARKKRIMPPISRSIKPE